MYASFRLRIPHKASCRVISVTRAVSGRALRPETRLVNTCASWQAVKDGRALPVSSARASFSCVYCASVFPYFMAFIRNPSV